MSAVLKPLPQLRPMTVDDIEAVVAVEREIYEFPWTPGNFRDSLAANYSCWVYGHGAEIIGYAVVMLAAEEAHLLNLSIALARQNKGYGGRLIEQVLEAVRDYGAAQLFLEVRPSNIAGLRLYARHGFRQIGLRRDYYPARGGREDAVLLLREL